MSERAPYNFPTTHWSVVERAGGQGGGSALADLLTRYLPPLRAHLVFDRHLPPEQADDLLQSFISDKVIERQLVTSAVREKGRFRTFLLVALDRFVSNQLRNEKRREGPGGKAPLDTAEDVPAVDPTPSRIFEVAWAKQVLALAARRMHDECRGAGRADIWGIFEGRVLTPTLDSSEPVSYERLMEQFSILSADAAANLLVTAKRMFARSLKGVVGEYMGRDGEIDKEIAELRATLANSRP